MTPVCTASWMPLSTAGMNSRGTVPPTMPLTKLYPLPDFLRLDFQPHVAVLATTAGLAHELTLESLNRAAQWSPGMRPAACRRWHPP